MMAGIQAIPTRHGPVIYLLRNMEITLSCWWHKSLWWWS